MAEEEKEEQVEETPAEEPVAEEQAAEEAPAEEPTAEEPAPGNDYASLRADPDARRAVIGAYAGLERTLSRRDLARTPAEGPREYLGRVVDSLRRSRSAAGRLTGLYERAIRVDLLHVIRVEPLEATPSSPHNGPA